jgi:hypothetical protein
MRQVAKDYGTNLEWHVSQIMYMFYPYVLSVYHCHKSSYIDSGMSTRGCRAGCFTSIVLKYWFPVQSTALSLKYPGAEAIKLYAMTEAPCHLTGHRQGTSHVLRLSTGFSYEVMSLKQAEILL